MNKRYLVTAIGGDIGSSVVRCMRKEYDKGNLLGCDITPYVAAYDEVNEFIRVPLYREKRKYIDYVYKECMNKGITHILPMTEGEIKLFDGYRCMFQDIGIRLMINSSEILSCCFSKYKTAQMIKKLDLPSLKTWMPESFTMDVGFPVVVKSDNGCGSKSVKIAHDFSEFDIYVRQVKNAIVQEYVGIDEEEYTAGVFSDGRRVVNIAFKRTLGFGGMSIRVEKVVDSKIKVICEKIADYLNLKGAINIQMRKHNDEYYVFEINPRISSTVGFRYQLGFKDVDWWLSLLDGDGEKVNYIDKEIPVIGIRTLREKIFRKDKIFEGGGESERDC